MDKAQKSLVDTYFRKRKIAREQSRDSSYEDFEITYMMENNIPVNIFELNNDEMTNMLIRHPEYIDVLKPRLKSIYNNNISKILRAQPQLINNLEISRLDGTDISWLLTAQPQLIDRFDLNKVMNADGNTDLDHVSVNIARIVAKQPQLADRFDLNKVKSWHILGTLYSQPQLIDRFDLSTIKNKKDITRLLVSQPQLKPYFDKINANG